ncbi:MAG: 16S rRNA (guanine(527)-N(7))-methyltransferase RsmG [Dichotomicrobium sp.]
MAASGPEEKTQDARDVPPAFDPSPAQMEKLETYAALLRKWQKAVNLVSPGTLEALWERHFADSAQLQRFIPPGSTCLDFGSGAGFPGMVLAVLTDPAAGIRFHLVESNARKCAFLHEVARQTGTAVEIHNARIEEIARRGTVTQADVIMARAVAPLATLFELSRPFFRSGTVGLFPKGRRAKDEVAEARKAWTFRLRAHPSATEPGGKVLEVGSLERLEGRT